MKSRDSLLRQASEALRGISSSPELDAALLLCHVTGRSRSQVLAGLFDELSTETSEIFWRLVQRRKGHEPLAYILGEREFWGLDFQVNAAVLTPRPETELLVEFGLEHLKSKSDPLSILELGTGSGCIAVALAHELKMQGREFSITATDLSSTALGVANNNAERHGVQENICFKKGDWFEPLQSDEKFALIISNPPYISKDDPLQGAELVFEPSVALYAERSGLSEIEKIVRGAGGHREAEIAVFIEFGASQAASIELMLEQEIDTTERWWSEWRIIQDLSGLDRVLSLR